MTKWLFINLTVHSPAVLHLLLFGFTVVCRWPLKNVLGVLYDYFVGG